MKINKLTNTIHNPKLHYKLDPGEPGMATPSLASQSIAKVALHEATNVRRFKKEAAQEGGIVVYSFIGLNIQFRGSFLAATSGKSKAFVIVPVEEEKKDEYNKNVNTNNRDNNAVSEQKNTIDNEELKTIENSKKNIESEIIIEEKLINGKIDDLTMEKNILENKISSYKSNDLNDDRLKIELDNLMRKIRYLENRKEIKKQQGYFSNLMKSNNIASELIGLINQGSSDTGNIVDDLI